MTPRHHAAMLRFVLISIWLANAICTPASVVASLVPALARPVGVLGTVVAWALRIPNVAAVVPTIRYVAIVAALLCLCIPSKQRGCSGVLCLAVLMLDSAVRAVTGFANHASVLSVFGLCIVPFSYDARGGRDGGDDGLNAAHFVRVVQGLAVIAYTFIGLNRVMVGGIGVFTGDAILVYLGGATRGFWRYGSWLTAAFLGHAALIRVGFALMTALEVTTVGMIVIPRWRFVWLAALTTYHCAIAALMNVWFVENVVLIWVLFAPLTTGNSDRISSARVDRVANTP